MKISDLKLIETKKFYDERGFFTEHYKKNNCGHLGLPEFIQDNHSRSKPNVIRGLHYQIGASAQAKLISVIRGKIWDVAVDLRPNSPDFGKYEAVELSDENGLQLFIPAGFAHGFCVLGDSPADVLYKVDKPYDPNSESGIIYNDPKINILWPIKNPIVSSKDLSLGNFHG